jgi:uncharacterized protein (DUF1501 family)
VKDFAHKAARRLVLKQAGAFGALGAGAPLAMSLSAASHAAAATADDYKALVCIFLHGGNDAFNTVLATDDPSWAAYTAVRNQLPDSIALLRNVAADASKAAGSPARLGGVLPISPATVQPGRSFALHPQLGDAQALFNTDKRLAVVANVGPLIEPLSKADYLANAKLKPKKLFSHNDQQSTWLAMAPEGATVGWGGRFADALAAGNNNSMFTAISPGLGSVWMSGQSVRPYQVGETGPIRLGTEPDAQGIARVYGSEVIGAALERLVSSARTTHVMANDLANINVRSMQAERVLTAALPAASAGPFGTSAALQYTNVQGGKANNPLAVQLQTVARIIAAQGTLGLKRQVFFVSLGAFDTHNTQNKNHADLLAKVNHALRYFDTTLASLGMGNQVTTFTASDFGRSFTSNGDGTDHGWGGHQLVMGGAVQGGDIYGEFPVLAAKNAANNQFDGSPDQLHNGVLLPRISVDQFGATLGRWFGLSTGQLADVFPNLTRFGNKANLGFMKA